MSENDNRRKLRRTNSNSSITSQDNCEDMKKPITRLDLQDLQVSLLDNFKLLLKSEMDVFKTELKDVNDKIDNVSVKVDALENKISNIDVEVGKQNTSIVNISTDILRFQRLNDVIITGIPYVINESVGKILTDLSLALGFMLSPYTQSFRVKPKAATQTTGQKASPIIVKFSCQAEKTSFLSACKNKTEVLKPSELKLNFASNSPIHVFESLLPQDDIIRKKSKALKKAGVLYAVIVSNGVVCVKPKDDAAFIKVNDLQQLEEICSKITPPEQQTTSEDT